MLRRVLLALVVLVAAPAPAQAQGEALQPELVLGPPIQAGESGDGIPYGGVGTVEVGWTLTFPNVAVAAEELGTDGGTIAWSLDCPQPLTMPPTSTPVPYTPGEDTYEGRQSLQVAADPAAPGLEAIPCTLTGDFSGASMQAGGTKEAPLVVAYHADISISVAKANRSAGPQKMIPYPVDVTNNGNARTIVHWELLDSAEGRWALVLPDPVVVEPGQTQTAIVQVATSFHNGYNKDHESFELRARATAAVDPEQSGSSQTFTLGSDVRGWYIPGPSMPLAVLALAGLALMARRGQS